MQISHVFMVKRLYVHDGIFQNTRIISMNGGFVSNAVCDNCTTVIPAEAGLKEKLEQMLSETKLQEYKVTEAENQITIMQRRTGSCQHPDTWYQRSRCYHGMSCKGRL